VRMCISCGEELIDTWPFVTCDYCDASERIRDKRNATAPAPSPTLQANPNKDVVVGGSCAADPNPSCDTSTFGFNVSIERAYHRPCDLCNNGNKRQVGVSLMLYNGKKRTADWTLCFAHARGVIKKLQAVTPPISNAPTPEGNHADTTPGTSDVEAPEPCNVPKEGRSARLKEGEEGK
jgi:hypothetical protein